MLAALEAAIRDPAVPADRIPPLAHQQQVIYRVLSRDPQRTTAVRSALAPRWRWVFDQHIAARREFLAMHRGPASPRVPAWRIQPPAPQEQLLKAYRSAAQATGIPWAVLAAVNLVETGMGRLQGLSVAGARGPMQFLPSTWNEPGIGAGSIDEPADAIAAAARYLVRRGGPENLPQAIWGYNNSWNYVRAVQTYAALMREDPRRFHQFHQWQIHYASPDGDLWLPEGYEQLQPLPVATYLQQAPWSSPSAR